VLLQLRFDWSCLFVSMLLSLNVWSENVASSFDECTTRTVWQHHGTTNSWHANHREIIAAGKDQKADHIILVRLSSCIIIKYKLRGVMACTRHCGQRWRRQRSIWTSVRELAAQEVATSRPPHSAVVWPLRRLRPLFIVIDQWRGCVVTATTGHPWRSGKVTYFTCSTTCRIMAQEMQTSTRPILDDAVAS